MCNTYRLKPVAIWGQMLNQRPATQRANCSRTTRRASRGFRRVARRHTGRNRTITQRFGAGPVRPVRRLSAILERSAERTGREDFGLLLGSRQTLATVGPLAQAVRSSATLGEALADFTAFQISNSTGAATYLHRRDNSSFLGYGTHDPSLVVSPYAHDIVLAVEAMMLRELTGRKVRAAEFSTMRFRPADPGLWDCLGARVRFGEAETGCYISVRDLSFPLASADRRARDDALRKLASVTGAAPWGWAGRTRHALRALILEGRSGMPEVARHLDIEPRTLRRALSREGTTFEEKSARRFASPWRRNFCR